MGVIDEVKQRLDIVEVVSQYVQLHKTGRNFKALCPFHTEKTPSFIVSPERQSWHCFGCGAGGDVFTFVMKKEGISFGQALPFLAQKVGIDLTPRQRSSEDEATKRLAEINEAAAQYYHNLLLSTPAARVARDYLEHRGITKKTIDDFQLGYSLDSWAALREHLLDKGYDQSQQVVVGLLVETEAGETYDRFRNRLMFPITDRSGRVLGFGARALDDSLPKYLNSPETPLFDKGGILYGIDRAKTAIRERGLVVIVEGYMDVLTAQQHGFNNVVASMGTAVTERQIGTVKGLANNFALALDADVAGDEATMRSLESVWHIFDQRRTTVERGLTMYQRTPEPPVTVIPLPRGRDPDDIIQESPEAWQRLVDKAIPVVDYIFQAAASKLDLANPRDKSAAVERLFPFIARMEDSFEQDHYFKKLARLIQVDERTLEASVGKPQPTRRRRPQKRLEVSDSAFASSSRDQLEEYCLCLLLQHSELREESAGLLPYHFDRIENREIFTAWRGAPNLESLRQNLDINLHEHLNSLVQARQPPISQGELEKISSYGWTPERMESSMPAISKSELEEALVDCVCRLEERRLRKLISEAESIDKVAVSQEAYLAIVELGKGLRDIERKRNRIKKEIDQK